MNKLRTAEYRIGVIGLLYSGKTVLLTSLIDHLKNHDIESQDRRFRIGDGKVMIRKFREKEADQDWNKFLYESYRESLEQNRRWPEKTHDRHQYVCRFDRSDWRHSGVKLKLYDIPGERFADAIMFREGFAKWSAFMLNRLRSSEGARAAFTEYFGLLDSRMTQEPKNLIRAYRLGMARSVLAYRPYISPSTFLLDVNGDQVRTRECKEDLPAETIAENRLTGLCTESEFTPLPPEWLKDKSDLARHFSVAYRAYRKQVVLPIFRAIRRCHGLIVMVDVLNVLSGGHGSYNDTQKMMEDVIDVLNPGQTLVGRICRAAATTLPHRLRPGRITKVAFVVPKMDLVHEDDRDKARDLARALMKKPARDYDGLAVKFLNCSAVVATTGFLNGETSREYWVTTLEPVLDEKTRMPIINQETRELEKSEKRYACSRLPRDGWPVGRWSSGLYRFPRIRPPLSPRMDCPPEHIGLDTLFNFLID